MAGRKRNPLPPIVWSEKPLQILSAAWNLAKGEHPANTVNDRLFEINPFVSYQSFKEIYNQQLPLRLCEDGHNVMADESYAMAAKTDPWVPISPLFVRDLSGRIIYTGYGPEVKEEDQWTDHQFVLFPKGCRDVMADVGGADLIENVFFTRFRALDISFDKTFKISGFPKVSYAAMYQNINLYPYKLRLDTFYQDGWRLPQTERLYIRKTTKKQAKTAAQIFIKKWESRPNNQKYEDFYDANEGDVWFEEMFFQGCTVIPTVEGANGYNKVSSTFDLEGFWPGRAVKGLHKIVEKRADKSPKGTILDVKEPGYVTYEHLHPAKVVISDGSLYKSPHKNSIPLLPNLKLPHPRASSVWGSTWLPTDPEHFEAPAIWGWDTITGHFMQMKGPLWDPVHYYYKSTPKVVKSMRKPLTENPHFSKVPDDMRYKFHPVVPMQQYETISRATQKRRQQMAVKPLSAIDAVALGKVCEVGYHPLPLALEYELDNFWFPELDPRVRVADCPQELLGRLAPTIKSFVTPETAIKTTVASQEKTPWLFYKTSYKNASGHVLEDYPHLTRYLQPPKHRYAFAYTPTYLAVASASDLNKNVKRIMGGEAGQKSLENILAGLYDAVYTFRETSLWLRRLRHRLLSKYTGWYVRGWWEGLYPHILEEKVRFEPDKELESGQNTVEENATVAPVSQ